MYGLCATALNKGWSRTAFVKGRTLRSKETGVTMSRTSQSPFTIPPHRRQIAMPEIDEPPQIIARAFDDEPCVLYAVQIQASGRHVNVCRELPARPVIGWPVTHAFDY